MANKKNNKKSIPYSPDLLVVEPTIQMMSGYKENPKKETEDKKS